MKRKVINKPMKHIEDYPDVLLVEDVQAILQIGRSASYALVGSGQLRAIRLGRSIRIPKQCLLDYLAQASHQDIDGRTAGDKDGDVQ